MLRAIAPVNDRRAYSNDGKFKMPGYDLLKKREHSAGKEGARKSASISQPYSTRRVFQDQHHRQQEGWTICEVSM